MIPFPNKHTIMLKYAYDKGYRVKNGEPYSYKGHIIKGTNNGQGYYTFSLRIPGNRKYKSANIKVHRLAAYQKYGLKMFENGIEVRHLNGNRHDNTWNNICIGTHSDNMMDQSKETRMKKSLKAATKRRRFIDEEMEHIRTLHKQGWSYTKLMKEFNISSKGTMSYIINNKYQTMLR